MNLSDKSKHTYTFTIRRKSKKICIIGFGSLLVLPLAQKNTCRYYSAVHDGNHIEFAVNSAGDIFIRWVLTTPVFIRHLKYREIRQCKSLLISNNVGIMIPLGEKNYYSFSVNFHTPMYFTILLKFPIIKIYLTFILVFVNCFKDVLGVELNLLINKTIVIVIN